MDFKAISKLLSRKVLSINSHCLYEYCEWNVLAEGWRINRQLDGLMAGCYLKLWLFSVDHPLCCIMLWRSVLPYICFSVHSAHALQLLDARRTKVCPYVCTTLLCAQHRVTFSVTCISRHLAIPLHQTTSSPMKPVNSDRKWNNCSSSTCLPVVWTLMFPFNQCTLTECDSSGFPSTCSTTNPTTPDYL